MRGRFLSGSLKRRVSALRSMGSKPRGNETVKVSVEPYCATLWDCSYCNGMVTTAKQFHVLKLAEDRGFVLCNRKKKHPIKDAV